MALLPPELPLFQLSNFKNLNPLVPASTKMPWHNGN